MSIRYLVVKGYAGLANRLNTICAAIDFAAKTKRQLIVDWSDGLYGVEGENVFHKYFRVIECATYPELSEIPELNKKVFSPNIFKSNPGAGVTEAFKVINRSQLPLRIPEKLLCTERLRMLNGYWLKFNQASPQSLFEHFREIYNLENAPFGRHLSLNHSEDIVFYLDSITHLDQSALLRHIRLTADISEKIARFIDLHMLSQHSVGVHVRSTDKQPAVGFEKLFNKLESLESSVKKIFLATDSKKVSKLFNDRFNNVIEYSSIKPSLDESRSLHSLTRGLHHWAVDAGQHNLAEKVLEEAIMDLWVLGSCDHLLFQGNSSFSRIARALHHQREKSNDWTEL